VSGWRPRTADWQPVPPMTATRVCGGLNGRSFHPPMFTDPALGGTGNASIGRPFWDTFSQLAHLADQFRVGELPARRQAGARRSVDARSQRPLTWATGVLAIRNATEQRIASWSRPVQCVGCC
jgi:hypothetical protein